MTEAEWLGGASLEAMWTLLEGRLAGRKARLFVAETEVVLHRPARRKEGNKKVDIPGPPLPLRLVVTEVRDTEGRVLARWLLLSNVPPELADAATIATTPTARKTAWTTQSAAVSRA